jgi:hypothetical protein
VKCGALMADIGRAVRSKLGDLGAVLRYLRLGDVLGISLPPGLAEAADGAPAEQAVTMTLPRPVDRVDAFVRRGANFEMLHVAAYSGRNSAQ